MEACPGPKNTAVFKFDKVCPNFAPGHAEAWGAYKEAVKAQLPKSGPEKDGRGWGANPKKGAATPEEACKLDVWEDAADDSKMCGGPPPFKDTSLWYHATMPFAKQAATIYNGLCGSRVSQVKACGDAKPTTVFKFEAVCPNLAPGHAEAWAEYKVGLISQGDKSEELEGNKS